MDGNKKQILDSFIRIVDHTTDKEYQKRVWIKNEGPECQAFDDAVCDFFDIGEPILNDYKNFGITELQYNLLSKLFQEFDSFLDTRKFYFPYEFIAKPEWKKITEMAEEVLKAFSYQKKQ